MKMNPYADKFHTVDRKTGKEFNPLAFGKAGKSGNRKTSTSDKMFNGNGVLNAGSKPEAMQMIAGLLDQLSDGTFSAGNEPITQMTASDGAALVRQAFSNPNSSEFQMAGQALVNPIKEIIDYETVTAKLWTPRTVKQGEVIRYDKDPFVVAHVIAEDGQTPESQVEGQYIYPPEFEVTAFPTIELRDQYRAQFDILARAQDRARQAIEYQVDLAGINLLQAGGNVVNNTTFYATLNLGALESMRYQIERHRLVCHAFVINRQEVSDLVNTVSTQVDPVSQRELIMAGYIGSILNAMIVTTAGTNTYELLAAGEALAVTAPEYLGGMAQRAEMNSEPVNQFFEGKPRRGWFWWRMMALALVNPAGVALGQKT